jgi:hypothetical protein
MKLLAEGIEAMASMGHCRGCVSEAGGKGAEGRYVSIKLVHFRGFNAIAQLYCA